MRRVGTLLAIASCLIGGPAGVCSASPPGVGSDASDWQVQATGASGKLNDIACGDTTHGWIVGDGGAILATSDGGAHWATQASGVTEDLQSITCCDAVHAWALGEKGAILATTDGGAHWSPQVSGVTGTWLGDIACVDADHAWAIGYRIIATTDGGRHWGEQTFPRPSSFLPTGAIAFADTTHGWAAFEFGHMLVTSDGGASWQDRDTGVSAFLCSDIACPDALHAWAVGGDDIVATCDGGLTWTAQTVPGSGYLRAVAAADARHLWAVGDDGQILVTTDGGVQWTAQDSGTTDDLGAVTFADSLHGWALGAYTLLAASPAAPPPDTIRPTTTAFGPVTVKRGTTAHLKYRVDDATPGGDAAAVTISITTPLGSTVRTLALGVQPANTDRTTDFKANLRRGTYRWYVYATDVAGNAQSSAGRGKLVVK